MNKSHILVWIIIGVVLAIFFLAQPRLSSLSHTGEPVRGSWRQRDWPEWAIQRIW